MFLSDALKKTIENLPSVAGVYQMFDQAHQLLYVGKAVDLRRRVKSYFQGTHPSQRIAQMVAQIASIEVILTGSETEALLLEANLIQAHSPVYNIVFKDNKSYPFIHFSAHSYPRLEIVRQRSTLKGAFFGPYPNGKVLRSVYTLLQSLFLLRTCEDNVMLHRSRPCLFFQMKRCAAPCVGLIEPEQYHQAIASAQFFLKGEEKKLLKQWEEKMTEAASRWAFEEAAQWRDKIRVVHQLHPMQRAVIKNEAKELDIFAVAVEQGVVCIGVMHIRGGRQLGFQAYFFEDISEQGDQHTAQKIILQYYQLHPVTKKVIFKVEKNNSDFKLALYSMGVQQWIVQPEGIFFELWKQTLNNTLFALDQKNKAGIQETKRLEALKNLLELAHCTRIECFDISHLQGEATVGSCVVYENKQLLKKQYRRYLLNLNTPGNDLEAMALTIARRYQKKLNLPDLVLIDGGAAQVEVAHAVLAGLGCHLKVVGVAKGVERKAGEETLIVPYLGKTLQCLPHDPALHLIQMIRDEAHRFALKGHQGQRSHRRLSSPLESIVGIGVEKRRRLLLAFEGWKGLKAAGIEDIARVQGIGLTLAQRIYEAIHAL